MRTSLLLVVALGACSGGTSSPPETPSNRNPTSKCAFVADHLISLLTKEAQNAPEDAIDQMRAQFNRRCIEDAWSAEAQQCFLGLTAKEQVDTCAAKLTEAQRAAINRAPDNAGSAQGSAQ